MVGYSQLDDQQKMTVAVKAHLVEVTREQRQRVQSSERDWAANAIPAIRRELVQGGNVTSHRDRFRGFVFWFSKHSSPDGATITVHPPTMPKESAREF